MESRGKHTFTRMILRLSTMLCACTLILVGQAEVGLGRALKFVVHRMELADRAKPHPVLRHFVPLLAILLLGAYLAEWSPSWGWGRTVTFIVTFMILYTVVLALPGYLQERRREKGMQPSVILRVITDVMFLVGTYCLVTHYTREPLGAVTIAATLVIWAAYVLKGRSLKKHASGRS